MGENFNPSFYGGYDYFYNQQSMMQQPMMQMNQQQFMQIPNPTRSTEEPLNWEMVKGIDPNLLKRTGDLSILQPFINDFIVADFEFCPSRLLSHPLLVRLCMILQHALKYMSDVQVQMQKKLEIKEKEYKAQQDKLQKVYAAYKKADNYIKKHSQNYEKCPICRKKYKSMKYLDAHFAKQHPIYNDAWLEIRSMKPQNPSYSYHEKIKHYEDEKSKIDQKDYAKLVNLYNEIKDEIRQKNMSHKRENSTKK